VTGVYKVNAEQDQPYQLEGVAGPRRLLDLPRRSEAIYAESWLKNILTEMST
jgi:hypothetical protein